MKWDLRRSRGAAAAWVLCAFSLFGLSSASLLRGQQTLYNGIVLPSTWPPTNPPTQLYQLPPYITASPSVIPINIGRQLFVDDFLIQSNTLTRNAHRPTMYASNPVLAPGGPDSAGSAFPYSDGAWFDPADNLYKIWYDGGTGQGISYAYSADGLAWVKPSIPDAAVPNTNIVLTLGYRDSTTVWMDLNDPNPNQKFKAYTYSPPSSLAVYYSPDGIHWSVQSNTLNSISDRTTVFYNPFRNVWVDSMRDQITLPAGAVNPARGGVRVRYYAESPDLIHWTPSNPLTDFWIGPDDQDTPYVPGGALPELYNLDAVAYESLLVGMFSWFDPGPAYGSSFGPGPDLVELGVGFSRDGFYWVRPTRGSNQNAFIPASNLAGTWNAYNTQSVGGGFLVVGDQLWFYFSGRTLQKPASGVGSTGVATLRRDGFYSMDAGAQQGTLVTRKVQFTGNHMFVNVDDAAGQLLVDVVDQNGNVIAPFTAANCTPISRNSTAQEVTWSGATDLSSLAGKPVQFRFYLTNGSLYSFWVTPSANGASYGYIAAGGPGFTGTTDTVGRPAAGGTVGTPLITPSGGSYTAAVQLVITDATLGAAIYYTLDGSNPTPSSTLYVAPFSLSSPTAVKAQAFLAGFNPSLVTSATFVLPDSIPPTVAIVSPLNNQKVIGSIQLIATASDNIGVASVKFGVDGGLVGSAILSPPYTFSLDTTTLTNGTHQIVAIATDTSGNQSTATVNITVNNSAVNAVTFLNTDTATLGNWEGTYGQDGNYIVLNSYGIPTYSQFGFSSANQQMVNSSTNDPRALTNAFGATGVETQFATVVSEAFNVSSSNNLWHRIALYFCDWDYEGRSITVQAYDATTNTLLDTRPLTNYTGGVYLVYKYRGSVYFQVTNNNPVPTAPTATISGFFWGGTIAGDTTPPSVAITAPATAAFLKGTVSLAVNASDNVGVTSVQYLLDGANLGTLQTSSPFGATWNTTAATGGPHQIAAVASDAAGNHATSTAVSVTVDNQPPTISLIAPASGATVAGTINVVATASDNIGVVGVQFQLDGQSLSDMRTVPPYTVLWNTTAATAGAHTLTAIAFDAAGNSATTSIPVKVSISPPTVALTAPANGSFLAGTLNISANASDAVNLVGVQFQVDGVNFGGQVTAAPFTIPWNTTATTGGVHTISAIALNSANKTATASVQVTIDNQPPTVTLTVPAAGTVLVGTVPATATATDNIAVATVQFQVDGANIGSAITSPPFSTAWNTTSVTSGTHTLVAVAKDEAGNTSSSSVPVFVDNQPPAVSITSPAGGAVISGNLQITANASDAVKVASVKFLLDGSNLGAPVTTTPYVVSWNSTTAAGGNHSLSAVALNAGGIPATSSSVIVTVDNQPPTVAITFPGASATVAGSTTITAAASDNVAVASVQFQVDGANIGSASTSAPYSVSWSTSSATNGLHNLTAVARDTAGNTTTSASVSVTVNNQPATVSITSPIAASLLRGTVAMTANASSSIGIASVQFQLDGVNLGGLLNAAPYTVSWNTSTASNGSHALTAIAKDTVGNAATSASVAVTVDNQPPTVSITAPPVAAVVSGTVNVTANAADNVSVAAVQFIVDGTNIGAPVTSAPYSISLNTTGLTGGTHGITAMARDTAGNTTTSAVDQVTVDNQPPIVAITTPPSGPVSGSVIVAANPTDNVAIASVQFQLDGVNLGSLVTAAPYTVTWNSTSASNGTHTLTAIARDTAGNSATSAAVSVVVGAPPATGTYLQFLGTDTTTLGNWEGVYGQDGNYIVQNSTAEPGYSEMTFTNANSTVLNAFATDPRALLKYFDQFRAGERIESQFYSRYYFDVIISSTDNQFHRAALYFCDYDMLGRSITITVSDANTNAVLDSRQLTSYTAGLYLVYNYRGRIDFHIANNNNPLPAIPSTPNATLSAIFWGGTGLPGGIDTTPPTASITAPSNQSSVVGTVNLTVNATDNVAVASVQYQLDGVNLGSAITASPFASSWNTTQSTNTTHTLRAVATDTSGNTATSAPITVTVNNPPPDTTPPSVSITAPANHSTVTGTVNLTVNATDNVGVASVQYQLDGVNLGTAVTTAPYSFTWNTTQSSNGSHALTAIATDTSGNTATSGPITVTVNNPPADTTPPIVSITAPASAATVSGTVTVTATASDNVGVTSVQFRLDNTTLLGNPLTAPPYSFSWNSTTAANGPHTLSAIASDAAGNTATASVAVTVNNVAPSGNTASFLGMDTSTLGNWKGVYGQDGNYIVQNSVAEPSYSSFGPTGAATYVLNYYSTDVRALQKYIIQFSATERIASYMYNSQSMQFDVSLSDGGTHRLALYFCDYEGASRSIIVEAHDAVSGALLDSRALANYTAGVYLVYNYTGRIYFLVKNNNPQSTSATAATISGFFWGGSGLPGSADTTPPSVSITAPANHSTVTGTVNLTVNATDNVGVASVQYQLDGVNLGTAVTTAPYSFTWNTTQSSNGSHALTAIATDTSGNTATSGPITVTVNNPPADTTPPIVSITAPASAATVSGTVTVTATASDNVGVTSVQFRLDNTTLLGNPLTAPPYSFSWNSTTAANGPHTLSAIASDAAGNTATASVAVTVNNVAPSGNTASFLGMDTSTLGNWKGVYGQDGNYIVQNSVAEPSYSSFGPTGAATYVLNYYSTDVRALQKYIIQFSATERIASYMYNSQSMQFDVSLSDGGTHRLALYFCDYEGASRSIIVEAHDAVSGALLDSRALANYTAGVYLVYNYTGRIYFLVKNNNPQSTSATAATISGFFWGGSGLP